MENLLLACSTFLPAEYPLWLGVAIMGLLGSITHCAVMCSPLVAAHMISTEKGHNSDIYLYHAGRIFTYALLGVSSVLATQALFGGVIARYGNALLIIAGSMFIASALLPKKTHRCCSNTQQGLITHIERALSARATLFVKGMLMGFMPCGMVYAVLVSVATLSTPWQAPFIMMVFGIATLPALQLIGQSAMLLGRYRPHLSKNIGRTVMALNGIFLCGLGMNAVSIN